MNILRLGVALVADTVLTVATIGAYAAVKTVDDDFLVKRELDHQRDLDTFNEVINAIRRRDE